MLKRIFVVASLMVPVVAFSAPATQPSPDAMQAEIVILQNEVATLMAEVKQLESVTTQTTSTSIIGMTVKAAVAELHGFDLRDTGGHGDLEDFTFETHGRWVYTLAVVDGKITDFKKLRPFAAPAESTGTLQP